MFQLPQPSVAAPESKDGSTVVEVTERRDTMLVLAKLLYPAFVERLSIDKGLGCSDKVRDGEGKESHESAAYVRVSGDGGERPAAIIRVGSANGEGDSRGSETMCRRLRWPVCRSVRRVNGSSLTCERFGR
ncbi:hypothetical protein PLICRDRAFT_44427 [Plicaturopsis crispa FD-325 SS-3]|nr:hypothetical protein PLICRDRAFT_44427 [Plicaturopsis crispa FD-325 SS-3]